MSNCRSCNAKIIWAKNQKTGSSIPIDSEPSEKGNVQIVADGVCLVLGGDELTEAIEAGIPLRLSHFATCPNAKAHRSKKK